MTNALRFAVLTALAACSGGGTVCDQTIDKFEDCGIEVVDAGTDVGTKVDGYCEDGSLEACTSQCFIDAPCESIDGSGGDATDYLACLTDCAATGTDDTAM